MTSVGTEKGRIDWQKIVEQFSFFLGLGSVYILEKEKVCKEFFVI